jgi:hypothetical protein
MNSPLYEMIRSSKTGAYLFISPAKILREIAVTKMQRACLCGSGFPTPTPDCDCMNCHSIVNGIPHPKVIVLDANTFDEQMALVYSYPPPVTVIPDLSAISQARQMQLLIWLESISGKFTILMAASSVSGVLPTIVSRSFVFKEVPDFLLNQEHREQATAIINQLARGTLKVEEPMLPADGVPLAQAIEFLIVEELEHRNSGLPNSGRRLPGSVAELQTLYKLVARYLENPRFHQLPLLLRSYQMLALMAIR